MIPIPSKLDVFDILLAVAAWYESISDQYHDGEMSKEVYERECSKQFQRLLSYANCVNSVNESSLIEFWTRHRNFAEWGLINPRGDAYTFLPPSIT